MNPNIDLSDSNILKSDFLRLTANLSNSRSDINSDGQATVKDVGNPDERVGAINKLKIKISK